MSIQLLFILIINVLYIHIILSQCHNNCNRNGLCSDKGICQCFPGWEGSDCWRRSCPIGPQFVGTPNSSTFAHSETECSGRGSCNYYTGECECYSGYFGRSCNKLACYNGCSGHGQCISLGYAAKLNDGYLFNRTTIYSHWDAEVIHGCRCDSLWTGADCSQRICPYGLDPRESTYSSHESVELVCKCTPTCTGKFKLQFYGNEARTWLTASSTANDLAASLMKINGFPSNYSLYASTPVSSYVNSSYNLKICNYNSKTITNIYFQNIYGDIPAISFYANVIKGGSIYFQTTQSIHCDCTYERACNGSFTLSFDGEVSTNIPLNSNSSIIINQLKHMKTIQSANVNISLGNSFERLICKPGELRNSTIIFKSSFGNVPRLLIFTSTLSSNHSSVYSVNSTGILSISTNDGRSDTVKECNGLGSCDYSLGICDCSYGWGPDDNLGPCGRPVFNTSDQGGVGRCPGVVALADGTNPYSVRDYSSISNHIPRLYISFNPVHITSHPLSTIEYFDWYGDYPELSITSKTIFINLTSNSSAGPLVLDNSRSRIIFVDLNPKDRFIGIANTSQVGYYKVWLYTNYSIFGLAMDQGLGSSRRRLYWTTPGKSYYTDGQLYWAYIDQSDPKLHRLSSIIGQKHLVDPMGIAIHVYEERIYWIDRNLSSNHSVLRSCYFDGSGYNQTILLKHVHNHTISTGLTDLIIDYSYNNTAFVIDKTFPEAIIGINLNYSVDYNDSLSQYDQYLGMYDAHVVTTTWQELITSPKYLALDSWNSLILWTDKSLHSVKFARYKEMIDDIFTPGSNLINIHNISYSPVGILLDRGLGTPTFDNYLNCYGHGTCLNYQGNWKCECDSGYYGNCLLQYCPKGYAWFHEPAIDEIAHDELVECSNMGVCDHTRGVCMCREGFEGSACERLSCVGQSEDSHSCSGAGRCLSIYDMAQENYNSVGDPDPITYGSNPRSPLTWDSEMIYGCQADSYGYYHESSNDYGYVQSAQGYKLDKYACPYTYNPRSTQNGIYNSSSRPLMYNVQFISCTSTSGYFSLMFRGQSTESLYYNDYASSLQSSLSSLSTIGNVTVSSVYGYNIFTSTICSPEGNIFNITFLTELGDIPNIQVTPNYLSPSSGISIWSEYTEESELYECGGHGDCDLNTGLCRCYKNYGTSNGFGKRGNFGDCGHNILQN